jgi:hypothetical protein
MRGTTPLVQRVFVRFDFLTAVIINVSLQGHNAVQSGRFVTLEELICLHPQGSHDLGSIIISVNIYQTARRYVRDSSNGVRAIFCGVSGVDL